MHVQSFTSHILWISLQASKCLKQLRHAGVPHAHVYVVYSCDLVILIYYYLITLLFTVADLLADRVDWWRHVEPHKKNLSKDMSAKYGLTAANFMSLFISADGWRTLIFMSATNKTNNYCCLTQKNVCQHEKINRKVIVICFSSLILYLFPSYSQTS